MAINGGAACLPMPRASARLTEESHRLKQRLRHQERQATGGFFGAATSSAKRPVKAKTPLLQAPQRKGARPGHPGAGRQAFEASQAERAVDAGAGVGIRCPDGHVPLEDKGTAGRAVLESHPVKAERVLYRRPKKYGPRCRRTFHPRPPTVRPKSLYGNQLMATAATMHDLHGIPLGRGCEQTGLGPGRRVEISRRLGRLLAGMPARLRAEYRQAPGKHAADTGWRTNGPHGGTRLLATPQLRLFLFRQPPAASVPQEGFGGVPLPGGLAVERCGADNKAPCAIQYRSRHLFREVQALDREPPGAAEGPAFVGTAALLLALAMGRRAQPLSDAKFFRQATALKVQIIAVMAQPAPHAGIRHIQGIFRQNAERLYHWADDRRVPADNNLAERDLRPTVIARKVSFGSQSDAGVQTRGILLSVLHTLKKRQVEVVAHLKRSLDQLATDLHQDPFPLLFPTAPT
jgi:transposase